MERVFEKMRYTIDHKLQPTGESEMTRMERRQLEGERDRARGEKQAAEERAREMEREMDRVRGERDVAKGERDRARGEKQVAEERASGMEREMDRVRGERDVAKGERDRARGEKQVAEERARGMEREMDRVRGERDVAKGERDRVRVELHQALARADELQQRLEEVEGREHERLVVQEQAIAAEQRGPSWEVREDELGVTDERLGVGGWAEVKVANLKVAAKVLHEQLIYEYHRQLFRREMDMAARVSHPNLLRFLGARLEGGMAILTEFMPTSLRALVNRRPQQQLPVNHILSISIDVASALNYLHHMTPDPMIHRDLSSANVLLQPTPDGGWLAKVSDYGTANFQSQLQTENPGSPVYTAPESRDPAQQSPKMDIYSFGVLLVEMCTCDFPAPEQRNELIESIRHPRLVAVIIPCLRDNKDRRPSAAQLMDILHAMQ